MTSQPNADRGQQGFSLIEVSLALGLVVLALLAIHSTLSASVEGRKASTDNQRAHVLGAELLGRLKSINFGSPTDGTPSAAQLDDLFDSDSDPGTITLTQLVVPPDQPGFTFAVAEDGVIGTWRIRVTQDLDGNGAIDGPRDGRPDLFRMEFFFDERLVFETFRAAAAGDTVFDAGATY